jgi:predicted HTH transcriptional regulator
MNIKELQTQISLGEDSTRQFKPDVRNSASLASEMAAFANAEGGTIFLGVADDGGTPGLDTADVARINQLISNAASQLVKSPLTVRTENIGLENGRIVIVLTVPKGLDKPQFVVKAIRYPGDEIHVTDYVDTEDFAGPLPKIFNDTLGFVMRNLHKIQAGQGVNAPGRPEIPESVFEELLVNALVHRDYLVSAPVRLFVYDNRIEIISPGHLPDNLTVEKIRKGNASIRNPILVSYVAKGLLPYHGLGSGIKRALAAWPQIDFVDDRDGCLFTATVHRKPAEDLELVHLASKNKGKPDIPSGKRRENVRNDPECLSGKAFRNHPGAGCIDWHYRAISPAEHSETAKRRIITSDWRKKGRLLGGAVMTAFSEQDAEQVTEQAKNIYTNKKKK